MNKLTVVKVGGKILENDDSLNLLLHQFNALPGYKVLVHGGGRSATQLAETLNLPTTMIEGRRVTDEKMLDVVTMVYGGLINKRVVARLQALGCNAIGATGADMNLITSIKRVPTPINYGFVGDVKQVNTDAFNLLLSNGYVPVIAPITHDNSGNLLNTNADTMASETAKALANTFEVSLIYCFEKKGVLLNENDDNSVIPTITPQRYNELKANGTIVGGMIPKLDNAFKAIDAGVKEVIITRADSIATHGTTCKV